MGSKNAKPPSEPSPGRPHGLLARYVWPSGNQEMTVGEAIPRQMRTVGCTYDEAAAFVGVQHATLQSWILAAAKVNRGLANGGEVERLSVVDQALHKFLVDLDLAAAEVTIRWQGILEAEGRGGYPVTRTTKVERRDAKGKLIESTTTTVTETARPDVDAVIWKMKKQLRRYRDDRTLVLIGANGGIEIPDPGDDEMTAEVAESLRQFQARPKAIDATSTETNGHR